MISNSYFSRILYIVLLIEAIGCLESEMKDDLPQMLTENLNVTTFVGDTVTLPCEIANLGGHHVNWLKIQNGIPMTLTVGYHQFSRNMRYRVARTHRNKQHGLVKHEHSSHQQHSSSPRVESWNFEIRRVTPDDQGLYECYVKLSSKQKIKANVFLTVLNEEDRNNREKLESIALYSGNYIVDNPRSERLSSSVEKIDMPPNTWVKLRCNATGSLLSYNGKESAKSGHLKYDLQWYKDGKLIEQDSRRLKKWVSSYDNSNYMELELYAVDPDDSGTYQCKRDTTILKNVILEVVENGASRCGSISFRFLLLITFIGLLLS